MKNDYEIRGDYAVIYIRRHRDKKLLMTMVDTEDLEKVKAISGFWYACKDSKSQNYYVYGRIDGKPVALHRYILGFNTPGMKNHVDHFNNNSLDNRKCNLRILTPSGNHQNRKGASRHSKTGVRGVFWNKYKKKWEIQIRVNGKTAFYKTVDTRKLAEKIAVEARQIFMPYSKEASQKNNRFKSG